MMELENQNSVQAVSKVLVFAIISYSFYFNAIEVANYFALMPAFFGSLFSGYGPVSSFSTLVQAASLGNVVRFDSYAAAGNVCHYHDPGADGYSEICEGANGQFIEGCNAALTKKKVYGCSIGNCTLTETACAAEKQCHILGTGQPDCQTCDFTALRNMNCPAGVINAGSSFSIDYDVLATSSLAAGGVRPFEHRALFDNDGTKVAWHWNDQSGCTWSTFTFNSTAPSAGGSKTYTIKSLATTSNTEPNWASITPDDTKTCNVTVNGPPSSTISVDKNTPIALGNSINITISATDDRAVDQIQFYNPDTSSWNTQSCTGQPTSCSKVWTVTPTPAGTKEYQGNVYDNDSLSAPSSPNPLSVEFVNSCADWYYTAGVHNPSISNAQYVNYVSCLLKDKDGKSIVFDCGAGYEVHITHQGTTEAGYDKADICGTKYSGTWSSTITDCNAQTGSVSFTSDYSSHDYAGVTITAATCHSTDATAPTTTDNTDANWHDNNVTITLTCTDSGVGCSTTYYCIDTSGPIDCIPTTTGTTVLMTQTGWIRYYSTDLNSNTETVKNSTNLVMIDKDNPTSVFGANTPADGNWVRTNFDINVTDADTGGSNLATCKYSVCSDLSGNTCNEWNITNNDRITVSCTGSSVASIKTVTVGSSGNCHTQGLLKCQVQAYSTDAASRTSALIWRTYKVDWSAPTSSVTALSGTSAETFNVSWTSVDNPLIDASGIKCVSLQYKINAGSWTDWYTCKPSSGTVTLPDGILTPVAGNTYYFRSKADDNANNDEGYPAGADTSTKVVSLSGLESPTDGGNVTILTPTLDWSASTGANCYAILIAEGANPAVINKCSDPACAGYVAAEWPTATSYAVPGSILSYQKSYEWKAWPSATGCVDYRSPAQWSFNTKLPPPMINSPPSPVDSGSASQTPTLGWNRSGDANYYKIEFETPGETKRTDYNSSASDPVSYAVSPALLQGKTYTWRVFASNDGGSTYSPFASVDRTFTTGPTCGDVTNSCATTSIQVTTSGPWIYNKCDVGGCVKSRVKTSVWAGYWKFTLPSPWSGKPSYSTSIVLNKDVGLDAKLKVGTSADSNNVCDWTTTCNVGLDPNATYYVTIAGISGEANAWPVITATPNDCGTVTPVTDSFTSDSCSVVITHKALDYSDKDKVGDLGAVRYTDLGLVGNKRTVQIDDAPSGGCDNDVRLNNTWNTSVASKITLRTDMFDFDASHYLQGGYEMTSSNCKFGGFTRVETNNGAWTDPTFSVDKKTATMLTSYDGGISCPLFFFCGNPPNFFQTYAYDIYECLPSENINNPATGLNDGYNSFCVSKNPNIPYCDPTLKKCEPCSIVNNDGGIDDRRNPIDCPASNNPPDFLVIGRCKLEASASKGGSCIFSQECTQNIQCASSCCSAEPQPAGPGLTTGPLHNKCIPPPSSDNPINPYLCKSS